MRLSIIVCLLLSVTGCTQPLYDWGGYHEHLYRYYENPVAADSFRESLEDYLQSMESKGKKPAPGLYAELGTLYLQKADRMSALHYYEKERNAWPESQHMMAVLIQHLNKLPASKEAPAGE